MGNIRFAMRFALSCRKCRTNCATFISLGEAAKPIYEADRHAKKELKKYIRGVRPIERAIEHRQDQKAEVIRGYCLAVRSALTDDGRPPLSASGLKLYERIAQITASLARLTEKGGLPRELERMHSFLTKGLAETSALWTDVETGYQWVYRAAHLLTNDEKQAASQVRQHYETLLTEMEQTPKTSETVTQQMWSSGIPCAMNWTCVNNYDVSSFAFVAIQTPISRLLRTNSFS